MATSTQAGPVKSSGSTKQVVPVRTERTTPELLKAWRARILGLDLLLLAATLIAVTAERADLKAIGKDSAPSIIAAQHIKAALADMDADAANEMLSTGAVKAAAQEGFEAREAEAAKALVGAAENITYGEKERIPIQSIETELVTYEGLVQKAEDFQQTRPEQALQAYRDAATLMDGAILPAADALDGANDEELEAVYRTESKRSGLGRAAVLLVGLLLVFALLGTQVFLDQRMHRLLNPFLIASTVAVVLMAGLTLVSVTSAQGDLRLAKEDAFDSLRVLWRSRALAYQANAEESRYLLDPVHSADDEWAFFAKADILARLPAGQSAKEAIAQMRSGSHEATFPGYLGQELNNITFEGEREPAVEALENWETYVGLDAEIRKLSVAGRKQEATALCLGTSPGQSNWAFAQFDEALGRVIRINQEAFDRAVNDGFVHLHWLEAETAVLAGLAAVFAVLGLAPRIREYE